MNFYTLHFGSTGLQNIIDEAYLYVGGWAKLNEPEPVAVMGSSTAWIPRVEYSQSLVWRPSFKVLIIEESEHALLQTQTKLVSLADGVRRTLTWRDRDAGTIRMTWDYAVMLTPEFVASDSPAAGRWTEQWILHFLTDQQPYSP